MENTSLGQIAFQAYRRSMGDILIDDKPVPTWEELSEKVRAGWEAAGGTVADWISFYQGDEEEAPGDPMEPLSLLIFIIIAVIVLAVVWFAANSLNLPAPVPIILLLLALLAILIWLLPKVGI